MDKEMVWSNLYKIAPEEGNPNEKEQEYQLQKSIELVKLELNELKPKYCIVLTNKKWWDPFGEKIIPHYNSKIKLPKGDFSKIEYYGTYKNTQIVVTKRPPFGNSDEYVQQIKDLIKNK